ncbi:uncharacterized protein LOC116557746 [Sapajus apella]|uniref:Uncharacterized protein LOC116557746 n=1 Tax=Sapajus apella TaxID=9515 RepID=A0A6J3IL23_SAPAP|nr:uncharacterized protein LOC116557746 [Sapajus apella]
MPGAFSRHWAASIKQEAEISAFNKIYAVLKSTVLETFLLEGTFPSLLLQVPIPQRDRNSVSVHPGSHPSVLGVVAAKSCVDRMQDTTSHLVVQHSFNSVGAVLREEAEDAHTCLIFPSLLAGDGSSSLRLSFGVLPDGDSRAGTRSLQNAGR